VKAVVKKGFRQGAVMAIMLVTSIDVAVIRVRINCYSGTKQTNSVAFYLPVNYTDRPKDRPPRPVVSIYQSLRIEGVRWSAKRIPTAANLDYLDQRR
jgi:hypothetical protein